LSFAAPDLINRFGGSLKLDIENFTTLEGRFSFEKLQTAGMTEIRVAGTNINAVLGSNPDGIIGNSDDVGARITSAKLGPCCSVRTTVTRPMQSTPKAQHHWWASMA
jgi:hypothetical protein